MTSLTGWKTKWKQETTFGQLGDGLQAKRQRRSGNKGSDCYESSVRGQDRLELDLRLKILVEGGAEKEISFRNQREMPSRDPNTPERVFSLEAVPKIDFCHSGWSTLVNRKWKKKLKYGRTMLEMYNKVLIFLSSSDG